MGQIRVKGDRRVTSWLAGVVMVASFVCAITNATPAGAIGGYDNARIADIALSFWNGHNGSGAAPGAAACQAALAQYGYSADSGGQCRAFVNCVVVLASKNKQHVGGGSNYFSGFTNAGGIRITDANLLVKGDIVQVGDGSNPNNLHTYVIVSHVTGDQFMVVDSNHNPSYPETVNYYERTVALSANAQAFQMGTVKSGPVITSYTDASINGPGGIVAGPDGALWFTNYNGGPNGTGSIGRITTTGTVTNYTDPSIYYPGAITVGPDGALWFTNYNGGPYGAYPGSGSIGRITTAGVVSNFIDPSISGPSGITAGPGGALWFTNINGGPYGGRFGNGSIGRITTIGTVTDYTSPSIKQPVGITAGPDGALWFTNEVGGPYGWGSIGRLKTNGTVTRYTDPSITTPGAIAVGPDGALWFTNIDGSSIDRITTNGSITSYSDPGQSSGITAGPDGALWFTNTISSDSIGRSTTSGTVTTYTDPSINGADGITDGPDGALWFTNTNSIGRITTPT